MKLGAGLASSMLLHPVAGWARTDPTRFAKDPFTLGIASGDPTPDGVLLWTRLAPDPINGGGMPKNSVRVKWEVSSDDRMQRVVASGTVLARPESAHTVHVDVAGLRPSTKVQAQ